MSLIQAEIKLKEALVLSRGGNFGRAKILVGEACGYLERVSPSRDLKLLVRYLRTSSKMGYDGFQESIESAIRMLQKIIK